MYVIIKTAIDCEEEYLMKKIVSILLASAVSLSSVLPVFAESTFSDVNGNYAWAYDYVEDMAAKGLISGYEDGTYRPGKRVSRMEAFALFARLMGSNSEINKDVLESFKKYCKQINYPMNVLLEIFMRQYVDGRYDITVDQLEKWMVDDSETSNLNTTPNKDIYLKFKSLCQDNDYPMRYVLTVFMDEFSKGRFILEYVEPKAAEQNIEEKDKKV